MTEFINSVIDANKEIYQAFQTKKDLKKPIKKGFGGDISIKADLLAEEIFTKHLKSFGEIFSEESGVVGSGKDTIIIDPLDGSDNFKSNIPYYGTAVAIKNKVAITVNLANQDIFIKTKEFFKKGKLFEDSFEDVKINQDSSVGIFEKGYKPNNLQNFDIKYRTLGAVALSLSYAHEVDFVLFKGKRRDFDIVGGEFMCEDLFIYKTDELLLVSKNKDIFKQIKHIMSKSRANN